VQHSLRPRLAVIAPTMAEAVRGAGGWLFDQVMAGWDVTVLTADHGDADDRPVHILGARAVNLAAVFAKPMQISCLAAVAVCADLYDRDERVREMVLDAQQHGGTEVRFWDDDEQNSIDGPVGHRLSVAARAFKAQALAAADVPSAPDDRIERFRGAASARSLMPVR
jgi:hypothetical protein